MSREILASLIFLAGICQLSVLIASALVPIRLNWREEFRSLSNLHRQLYWVYGGYVVLSIVALALISLLNSVELASGSRLARSVCTYAAAFWGIRLALQGVFDVKQHLTTWWLRAGYYGLSVIFTLLTCIFACAAVWQLSSPIHQ
ncbi:MAG: hypothetical protein O2931_10460 [Planctomycetota bacterium]|nr:hypothetical protein [Planctomycetota bacterium]MDA1179204.1 hypothetical protein [Planctomycetota bacterium]